MILRKQIETEHMNTELPKQTKKKKRILGSPLVCPGVSIMTTSWPANIHLSPSFKAMSIPGILSLSIPDPITYKIQKVKISIKNLITASEKL